MRVVTFSSRLRSPTLTRGVRIIRPDNFASSNLNSFVVWYLSQTLHKHKCKNHAKEHIDKTTWSWGGQVRARTEFPGLTGRLHSLTVHSISLRTSLQVILSLRWESHLSQ